MAGILYVVATPIGNLGDVTLRALEVLREVDHVVAEDTRTSRKLLAAHGIPARVSSLHARSSDRRAGWVLERLLAGESVAYVTDAGAPAVSDPGSELVDRAHHEGIPVRAVPGASALTAALAVAGLPAATFRFLGFLPRGQGRRRSTLAEAAADGSALVLFESPRRLAALLEDLDAVLPDRLAAVCRELTKVHEEVLRGLPRELADGLDEPPRGEVTVVVAEGTPAREAPRPDEVSAAARELLDAGLPTREAAARLAARTGLSRREAYQAVLAARRHGGEDDR